MKTFLSFVLIFFTYTLSFSQQYFEIRKLDSSGHIVNDSFLVMNAAPTDYYVISKFFIKNISGHNVDLKLRRIEVDVYPGTESMCTFFLSPMYLEAGYQPIWVAPFTIPLNHLEADSTFGFYFRPMDEDGCSLFKFELINQLDTTEKESFHIKIHHNSAQVDCSTLNIEESSSQKESIVYPNPTKDILILDNLNITSPDRIEICDLLGKVLIKKNLKNSENKSKIDLSMLSEGMYLLKIVKENRVVRVNRIKKI